MNRVDTKPSSAAPVVQQIDRCVMCGLCAPHCPTYRLSGSELEAPRGRLSLMAGLWQGQLEAAPSIERHLDSCLLCRSCEAVCPSQVPMGKIMDATRARLADRPDTPRPALLDRILATVANPKRTKRTAWLARLYQVSGAQRLVRALGLPREPSLRTVERLLPPGVRAGSLATLFPTNAAHAGGEVTLFTGCMGPSLDRPTIDAAIRLLNAAGFSVRVPREQTCCGGLHLHSGALAAAQTLAKTNARVLGARGAGPVIALATGCAATLREYPTSLGADGLPPVREICEFLATEALQNGRLLFAPLPQRVLLHTPCTLRNVLKGEKHVRALLSAMPEIELIDAPSLGCCGAAGSYMLTQPSTAAALRAPILEAAKTHQPQVLATTNIGCALHLAAGLGECGLTVDVVHPVTLLARQLRSA